MIKPQSNAPSDMQPWVRTTDKQIEELEKAIARLQAATNVQNVDHEQNYGINSTFTFVAEETGAVVPYATGMNFTGDVKADSVLDVGGALTVGAPNRQELDPDTGEAIKAIPNFEVVAGQFTINPVTGEEYYSQGALHMTDSSLELNVDGLLSGDGLSITLSNTAQADRENIEILAASGDGTLVSYTIEKTDDTVASYVAGRSVAIVGIDPAGYNSVSSIILEVDSSGADLIFVCANETTDAYVAGGYVTIAESNSTYEGKLSVRGPGPFYYGATVSQEGLFVGDDGGNPATADTFITPGVVSAPEVAASYLNVDGTRVFVTSVEPSAPSDGDLWIDPAGSPLGGVAAPHATTHGVSGSDPVTLAQSQIVNLTTDLAGKAATVHTHAIADVTSLQTTLDAKVDESYQQVTTGWLTAATGWGSVSGTYTEKNGIVQVNVTATRTGADISAGNITNNTVCTISTGYRPLVETLAGGGPAGPVLGAYISASAGNVVITAIGTGISTGATIDINATYIKA